MKRLNIAIIGCGRISYKHIEAVYTNREDCQLVALCDIDIEKALQKSNEYKKLMKQTNIKIYMDYKNMLDECDIDIVAIATESGYHGQIGLYCLSKGKHTMIEKPMAMTVEECDELIKAATQQNVKLTVCHQNRFNAPVQKLRQALEQDRLGKVVNITARVLWNRNDEYYKQAPWRGTWELDGGTLMNQCIHAIDLLRWMANDEVKSVYAQCDTFLRPIEAEDFGALIIRFKKGIIGIVEGSACVYPCNLEETLSVFGEKGTVCLGGLAVNKIETWNLADERSDDIDREEEAIDNIYGSGHALVYKDFIQSIAHDRKPYITGRDGKNAVEIILMAYAANKQGKVIIKE